MSIVSRQVELGENHVLGTQQVRNCARELVRAIADKDMHPSIPLRVARAIVERQVSVHSVNEICDHIEAKRMAGELKKPGAYFLSSVRRLFYANGVEW